MNPIYRHSLKDEKFRSVYRRYLDDEKFRNAVLAAAHRERSAAMARLFSNSIRFLFQKPEPRRAPRTHFARQG